MSSSCPNSCAAQAMAFAGWMNAGHIAPYVAGKELPLENGLPLGLAAYTTYAERSFHLGPGHQLTLLTDGVVESRDQAGALLDLNDRLRSARIAVLGGLFECQVSEEREVLQRAELSYAERGW